MVNYANGKIYRILCNITGKQYIGSTTRPLSERLNQHKQNYKRFLKGKYHFVSSFEVLENCDFVIILIENYECKNKEELFKRERFYIEQTECVNKQMPIRSRKEYYEDNKEKIKLKNKKYYEVHKKELNLNNKKYYEDYKEELNIQQKEYREKNKLKINIQKREYREKNKEELNTKSKLYYQKKQNFKET